MTASQSVYVVGGTNRAGVIQSGDTAMRLMSWDGRPRELQFACSPDGLLVARTVRLSSGTEVANSPANPVNWVRVHYGDTADCSIRGDLELPSAESTLQPWSLAVASGGSLWLTWFSASTLRAWRFNGTRWDRFPDTGGLSIPVVAQYSVEADDGDTGVHLCPTSVTNAAVLKLNPSTSATTNAATIGALRTFVGGPSFNGSFQRTYGDGAGGLYVAYRDSSSGSGRDGVYHFNSSGVVTAKVYDRVATSGSDTIARDADGHWWEGITSTSLRHTFPDTTTESTNPFTITNGFAVSTSGFPKRGPRCRPLVTAGMNFGLHVGPASLA